ncbi:hypothetical protein ACFQ3Z_29010 [Streptomyces nogalater]
MAVAVWGLMKSMNKHMQKVDFKEAPETGAERPGSRPPRPSRTPGLTTPPAPPPRHLTGVAARRHARRPDPLNGLRPSGAAYGAGGWRGGPVPPARRTSWALRGAGARGRVER